MAAIKPEMIADWLRPHEALAALDAVYEKPSTSRHLLFERLKSGKIVAVAESSTWKGVRGETTGLIAIQRDQWERFMPREEFWKSGDLYINLGHYKQGYNTVEVWYHGIKFDPSGIQELVDIAPKRATELIPEIEPAAPQPEKGPPVAEEHLRAWFEVFKKVYGGTARDTEGFAHRSAQGMFPDKFVARQRIRDLRGDQKPGRKPHHPAK